MKSYKDAIDTLYSTKEDLLIIGLTGRTGAGCSTAAEILKRPYEKLDLEYPDREEWKKSDEYKFDIIKNYISDDKWKPFEIIEVSSVILSFVFEKVSERSNPVSNLLDYLSKLQKGGEKVCLEIINYRDLENELEGLNDIFSRVSECPLSAMKQNRDDAEKFYKLYIEDLPKEKLRFKNILQKYQCQEVKKNKLQDNVPIKYHLYTYLLQKFGNNIRASGNPYCEDLNQKDFYSLAKRIEAFINIIKNYKKDTKIRICIDAIRNVNESNYLKNKYRSYYLLSISVDETTRKMRLRNLNANEQASIDNVEYAKKYNPEEFFFHQNIAQCFEMADIHLYNEEVHTSKLFFLTWQLVKYITLMIHPGLITPTHLERCMQLAFNAKYNSGCLSRQVGAVITDKKFSVKAVGWNDVPEGQTACNLRDISLYCKGTHEECFSQYEREEERFQNAMMNIKAAYTQTEVKDRRFPYCFKDVHNGYTDEKNQVFTRALHAEENAFLQISKNGGQGIEDGFLFCTASPCELCSKKAYQLGITNIYYIDPYPGIAEKHILHFGKDHKGPKMNLFYGAIGEAYISLYRPLLPYKDELELLSGIECKKIAKEGRQGIYKEPETKDLHYKRVEFEIKFKSRTIIEAKRGVVFTVENGVFQGFERKLNWTGSSYDGARLLTREGTLIDYKDTASPYRYAINFGKELKKGDEISYCVGFQVKDESQKMHPYLAHYVKYPTDKLILRITVPENSKFIENVKYKRYADKEMEILYDECGEQKNEVKTPDDTENPNTYILEIENPNLFYTYSLEWEFVKEGKKANV